MSEITITGTNVNVFNDATYFIPTSRGVVCSGTGGVPTGTACPLQGDVAVDNCQASFASYIETQCIAPADAKCVKMKDTTWACVFPAKPAFFRREGKFEATTKVSVTPKPCAKTTAPSSPTLSKHVK